MKFAVVFVAVALATIVYAVPRPDDDKYSSKFDNINIDEILANPRLVDNYIACVEGTGKCTADGEELKSKMKEAIDECCDKCTDTQKEGVKKVWTWLEKEKKEKLNELKAKYDPEGTKEKECREKHGL